MTEANAVDPGLADGPGSAAEPRKRSWWTTIVPTSNPYVWALILAVGFGLLAIAVFAAQVNGHWRVLASAAMYAGASFAAGTLLGLLFGVPRSLGADLGSSGALGTPGPVPTVGANTNLEQISDWLTKVLVGASLVQFQAIGRGLGRLFRDIGPTLDKESGIAFAGCLVVYYAVTGFFSGWLFARLRLGAAMSTADALLGLSRRAEKAGDQVTADSAKNAANQTIRAVTSGGLPMAPEQTGLESLVSSYEQLRATEPPGPRRTTAMENLVRQSRQLARSEQFTSQDLRSMLNGSDGQRIMALAIMEGDLRVADADAVTRVISTPRSAFEQYHALYVANLLAPSLSPAQRQGLLDALADPAVIQFIGSDGSRSSLQQQILRQLSAAQPAQPPQPAQPAATQPPPAPKAGPAPKG